MTDEHTSDSKIPVTLVTGFLGSGKTTFIHRLLKERHGMRIAVLQNEFSSEMGIEKPVLSAGGASVFELPNGCLCCSLRNGIVEAVESILQFKHKFDWLVVEAAGNVDPLELVSNFWVDPESQLVLDGVLTVTCPTVLCSIFSELSKDREIILCSDGEGIKQEDATNNANRGMNHNAVSQRFKLLGNDTVDGKDMHELMAKQLSVADVIIINKIDRRDIFNAVQNNTTIVPSAEPDDKHADGSDTVVPEKIKDLLKSINPNARLIAASFCNVNLDVVMNLQMFNASRILTFTSDDKAGHHHHEDSTKSHVFVKTSGQYSLAYVNDFISTLLWESGMSIYRCKGIFRAVKDCEMIAEPNGDTSTFQLQSVGMTFEITEAAEVEIEDNRFLFIGPNLHDGHIINGLKLSQ